MDCVQRPEKVAGGLLSRKFPSESPPDRPPHSAVYERILLALPCIHKPNPINRCTILETRSLKHHLLS